MAMNNEKIQEVLNLYSDMARAIILDDTATSPWRALEVHVAKKIHSMVPACEEYLRDDRREKLMRWLGFMQGAWWVAGVFSVDELKKHNMPSGEEFKGIAQ